MELLIEYGVENHHATLGDALDANIAMLDRVLMPVVADMVGCDLLRKYTDFPVGRDAWISDLAASIKRYYARRPSGNWEEAVKNGEWPAVLDD